MTVLVDRGAANHRVRPLWPVHVEMGVGRAVVLVLVSVHLEAEGAANAQEADRDQHDPHHPFAPAPHRLEVEALLQEDAQGPDDEHARAVPQPPPHAQAEGLPALAYGQREERRQVVDSAHHVQGARGQAGSQSQSEHRVDDHSREGSRRPRADIG